MRGMEAQEYKAALVRVKPEDEAIQYFSGWPKPQLGSLFTVIGLMLTPSAAIGKIPHLPTSNPALLKSPRIPLQSRVLSYRGPE